MTGTSKNNRRRGWFCPGLHGRLFQRWRFERKLLPAESWQYTCSIGGRDINGWRGWQLTRSTYFRKHACTGEEPPRTWGIGTRHPENTPLALALIIEWHGEALRRAPLPGRSTKT